MILLHRYNPGLSGFSLLILSACADKASKDGPLHPDTADSGSGDSADTSMEEEICDGIDNDGDGAIDEGFDVDSDADGYSDCSQCDVAMSEVAEGQKPESSACVEPEPTDDPWNITELWKVVLDTGGGSVGVGCVHPLVADLNKDNFSDFFCVAGDEVYAISGRDATMLWKYSGLSVSMYPSIGDIDDDGWFEIIGTDHNGYMTVLSSEGELLWKGSENISVENLDWRGDCSITSGSRNDYGYTALRDIDHDGTWELLTPFSVVDVSDGSVLYSLDFSFDDPCGRHESVFGFWFEMVVADIDGDSRDEVMFLNYAFDSLGEVEHIVDIEPQTYSSNELFFTSALATDVDGDSDNDYIAYDFNSFYVIPGGGGTSTKTQNNANPTQTNMGNHCAGELDGDEGSELVILVAAYLPPQQNSELQAWDAQSGLLWSRDINLYHPGQCAVFDFDGDGIHEIVYTDNLGIYIVDGQTGEERYSLERFGLSEINSITSSVPIIVDIDGDGSTELAIVSPFVTSEGEPAIRVLSHAEQGWPTGGRIWPWSHWSGVGMRSNGQPQNDQPPYWVDPGLFRGQAQVHRDGADLQPVLHDACVAEAEVRLSVGVENLGPYEFDGAIEIEALDSGGAVVASGQLLRALAAEQRSETVELVIRPAEVAAEGLTLRVRAEDSHDCNLHNNAMAWAPGEGE